MRNTFLEIDLRALENNYNEIKKFSQKEIIYSVVKCNAYGLGMMPIIDHLISIGGNYFAVSEMDDAIKIKKKYNNAHILLLNTLLVRDIELMYNNNLNATICDLQTVNHLNNFYKDKNKIANINIKLNTGMNRLGIDWKDAFLYLKKINSLTNINIVSIFTHLSSSSSVYTHKNDTQIIRFEDIYKYAKNLGINCNFHISNSGSILKSHASFCNAIRPGSLLYGHPNELHLLKNININLKPLVKFKSEIIQIRTCNTLEGISYNETYITNKVTKVAVLNTGYKDGIHSSWYNSSNVYINNIKTNIIGTICMDYLMIDISNIPDVKIGDLVEIINYDNTILNIALKNNLPFSEVTTSFPKDLKRVYIR